MDNLISIAKAARLLDLARPTLYRMRKEGAAFFVGSKIDSSHEEWKEYAERVQIKKQKQAEKEDFEDFGDLECTNLVASVNAREKKDSIVQTLTEARRKKVEEDGKIAELKRRKLEGNLVEALFVKQTTIEYLTTLNKRVMTVGERTVDRILQLAIGLGEDARQPIVDLLIKQLSHEIQNSKRTLRKVMMKKMDE